jgi:hypothetical protein
VIIERKDWPLWLGEADGDPGSLLRPAPEDVTAICARLAAGEGIKKVASVVGVGNGTVSRIKAAMAS